jgi:predicted DNA-binding transcriptional regulator AlpA
MDGNTQTIAEFCKNEKISKSLFYKLRKQGLAPRIMKIGRLTRISSDSINDWRASMQENGHAAKKN